MYGDPNYEPDYEKYYQHWSEYDYYTNPKTVHYIKHNILHPGAKYASYLEVPLTAAAVVGLPLLMTHSLQKVKNEKKEKLREMRRATLAEKESRKYAKTIKNIDSDQLAAARTAELDYLRGIRSARQELGERKMLERETEKFEQESKNIPHISFAVPERQILRHYDYDKININKQAQMIANKINKYGIDKFNEELAQDYDSNLIKLLTRAGMENAFFEGTYIPKPFRQFLSENIQLAAKKATRIVTPLISELKKNPDLVKKIEAYKRQGMPALFAQQRAYREHITHQRGGNMGFLNLPAKNNADNIYNYNSFHI